MKNEITKLDPKELKYDKFFSPKASELERGGNFLLSPASA